MFGTDAKTLIFAVANDDGHPGDGAILDPVTGRSGLYLNGRADIHGNLRVKQTCQENGVCTDDLHLKLIIKMVLLKWVLPSTIRVRSLPMKSSTTSILVHIDNIGSAGSILVLVLRTSIMYQDGSIDAFGISRYFNANGGRRWTYLAASYHRTWSGCCNPLQPNGNYLCNPSSSGNMVVYLPSDAQTGDMIRFIDITGNLTTMLTLLFVL